RVMYIPSILAHRGALLEAIPRRSEAVASPARLMNRPHRVEVQETRSSGQYDQGGEQARRPTPEGIPDNGKHGHGPQNRHVERREASVSFSAETRASRT